MNTLSPELEARIEKTPWLHIRSQFTYHAEATIIGTLEGLVALHEAVGAAISDGEGKSTAVATDGEGYEIIVRRSRTVAGVGKPTYLDEEARELAGYEREYLIRESKAVRKQAQEARNALIWCRANGDPHLARQESPQ